MSVTYSSYGGVTYCFGVSDANTITPFDGTAVTATPSPGNIVNPSVIKSTTNANDMLIGTLSQGNDTVPYISAGTGFTQVAAPLDTGAGGLNNETGFTEYKIVSSSGSQTIVVTDSSSSSVWSMIGDAVEQGS